MGKSAPAKRRLLRPPMRIECTRDGKRGPYFLGYASNLSETGVFVQCLAPRPPGTRLSLLLHFSGSKGPQIRSDAEVRWVRRYSGKRAPSAGMGLRFTSLQPSDRSLLKAMCSTPAVAESAVIHPNVRTERRSDG